MRRFINNKKGFTLLELLLSVAILAILMLAVTDIFTKSFGSFRVTREIETNIADAQFLMNLFAKELRTSTVIIPSASTASASTVKFFEYSKQECQQYRFDASASTIEVARQSTDFNGCNNNSNLSGFVKANVGSVTGSFAVIPSRQSTPRVGKVTMTMIFDGAASDPVILQTTTSLRDYGYVGF
jgi:prepilin-type N-terminal cleavage/methylation domain-containing protein